MVFHNKTRSSASSHIADASRFCPVMALLGCWAMMVERGARAVAAGMTLLNWKWLACSSAKDAIDWTWRQAHLAQLHTSFQVLR